MSARSMTRVRSSRRSISFATSSCHGCISNDGARRAEHYLQSSVRERIPFVGGLAVSISVKEDAGLDAQALRKEVSKEYREVATEPGGSLHFHTGRYLAGHLGYDEATTASLPDAAVESFAGVANVFSMRPVQPGERVVDIGSGAGFDCFVAARLAGATGKVVGVDMTGEML